MTLSSKNPALEVCFSPQLLPFTAIRNEAIVVVVDILRATTSIISALANGAEAVIPVSDLEEAKHYKKNGYPVAAERDGSILEFADFGNSAFEFLNGRVTGKILVFSTTNGTIAVEAAQQMGEVVLGGFSNISALATWLFKRKKDILILCSGWKNTFCLEDTIFAGALVEQLQSTGLFTITCDSAIASLDLWKVAKTDVLAYIEKAAHTERLRQLKVDDVLEFSFLADTTEVVPVLRGGRFEKAEGIEQRA